MFKNISKKYSSYRWLFHTIVWIVFFVSTLLPAVLNSPMNGKLYYLTHLGILIIASYINNLFLVKKYFRTETYWKYTLAFLLLWLISANAIFFSGILYEFPPDPKYFFKKAISAAFAFTAELFVFCLAKIAKELYVKANRAKEIELEKVQAELGLLRSQLDAHFLFNTLNNLYLLVIDKSDKAPDAILMLSDLLSFNIYETQKDKIPITRECLFIENYINLQRLRLSEEQKVFFKVEGESDRDIVPLIFFNFIENAFKHASDHIVVNNTKYYIYIEIKLRDNTAEIIVMNGKSKELEADDSNTAKGLGLNNTLKRLELSYKDCYDLTIDDSEQYNVHLKINEL